MTDDRTACPSCGEPSGECDGHREAKAAGETQFACTSMKRLLRIRMEEKEAAITSHPTSRELAARDLSDATREHVCRCRRCADDRLSYLTGKRRVKEFGLMLLSWIAPAAIVAGIASASPIGSAAPLIWGVVLFWACGAWWGGRVDS